MRPLEAGTSTNIYKGALVCINATGYAANAADTANFKIAGIATNRDSNTGADGAKSYTVEYGAVYPLNINSTDITRANIGQDAIVYDNDTVTNLTVATNDVRVGRIVGVTGSTAYVQVGIFAPAGAP